MALSVETAAQHRASLFYIYGLLPQLVTREAEFFLEGQSEELACFFGKRAGHSFFC